MLCPPSRESSHNTHLALDSLQTDPGLNSLLQSVVGYSPIIYDAEIVDSDGKVLLSTNAKTRATQKFVMQ